MGVKQADSGLVLTGSQVRHRLGPLRAHCTVMMGDARFAVPTVGWLRDECFPAFKEWMVEMGVYEWKDRHDCDDKANGFQFYCQTCFVKTPKAPACDGFAVGRVWYHINGDPTRGHAINWAVTDVGLVYIEPQIPQIVELNAKELASRFFIH